MEGSKPKKNSCTTSGKHKLNFLEERTLYLVVGSDFLVEEIIGEKVRAHTNSISPVSGDESLVESSQSTLLDSIFGDHNTTCVDMR